MPGNSRQLLILRRIPVPLKRWGCSAGSGLRRTGRRPGQDDLTGAACFFFPVSATDPGAVPGPLRPLYAGSGGPGETFDPGAAAARAREVLSAYQDTGELPLLWEAILFFRAAALATAAGDPDRAGYLSGLGGALHRLAERSGESSTLEKAVDIQRAAVDAAPAGHPGRAGVLNNLGAALEKLAERTGKAPALQEAVLACQAAVDATRADDPYHAMCLNNLGNALHALARLTADTPTLEQAVDAYRAAVTSTPTGDSYLAGRLANLGIALETLSEDTGNAAPLHEAVTVLRDAVAAVRPGHPNRAGYLASLGTVLQALAQQGGNAAAVDESGRCFAEAAGNTAAPAAVRITAYRGMARLPGQAGMSAQEALEAMKTAARLLPQVAPHGLARADRQYSLGRLASIAGLAAAAAVTAGQPGQAVELLEQTRGILAADILEARSSDLARLRRRVPRLAREFEDLRARIGLLDNPGSAPRPLEAAAGGQDPGRLRRNAGAAWEDLLTRIRAVSGFETFLRAPDAGELAAQAQHGPVIFPYTTPSRCDALILTSDPGAPVRVVPLPGLTEEDAVRQAERLVRARQAATSNDASLRVRSTAHSAILEVLGWLWDTVSGPVLASLGRTRTPAAGQAWPRVWWCPVGILAYLPLHAAGHHDDDAPGRRAVPDRVISSYITTVRGLAYSRSQHSGAAGTTLIIAAPAAPGAPSLDGVTGEADVLAALIPGAQLLADPTPARVLDRLPSYRVAHFACHGYADWADPAASQLALPGALDQPLTIADISALQLTGSLAYLSACDTTVTTPALADEAVHITGAFHLAGYAHVIGTLWPIDDSTASDLACAIYRRLTRDGAMPPDAATAARALHHVTRQLRDQYPGQPGLWAAHTHTGP